MASQWPAVIGTLSGASLGVASTWLLERTRWRRQRSERWDDARRVAYASLLVAAQKLLNALHDHALTWDHYRLVEAAVGKDRVHLVAGVDDRGAETALVVRELLDETTGLVEAAKMLASDDVAALVDSCYQALIMARVGADEGTEDSPWSEADSVARRALEAFRAGIRQELRISELKPYRRD